MSNTLNDNFSKAETRIAVTLYDSQIQNDGSKYIKVSRNTVTVSNLIHDIVQENRGVDPFMIQHAAVLLKNQIIKNLQFGRSVNVLDLGCLYPAIRGSVKGERPNPADLPGFEIRFTPSQEVRECIDNLVVDKVVNADTNPQINQVIDLWTGIENQQLTKGKTAKITGSRLKLGGDVYGISFIMVTDDGTKIEEADTISVERITLNNPKELNFYIPDTLTPDARYKIRITTSYSNNHTSKKTPSISESMPLLIVEEE